MLQEAFQIKLLSFFEVQTSSFPSLIVTPILKLFSNCNVVVIRASWPNFSYIYKNGRMGYSGMAQTDMMFTQCSRPKHAGGKLTFQRIKRLREIYARFCDTKLVLILATFL